MNNSKTNYNGKRQSLSNITFKSISIGILISMLIPLGAGYTYCRKGQVQQNATTSKVLSLQGQESFASAKEPVSNCLHVQNVTTCSTPIPVIEKHQMPIDGAQQGVVQSLPNPNSPKPRNHRSASADKDAIQLAEAITATAQNNNKLADATIFVNQPQTQLASQVYNIESGTNYMSKNVTEMVSTYQQQEFNPSDMSKLADSTPSTVTKESLGLSARSSILMDAKSKTVLFSDNSEQKMPMASMTKAMTMLILMEEVESGNASLEDTTTISEYAASQEGSECFLDAGKSYLVSDLLKATAIASANDASVAIAEYISGSEKVFAGKMNKRAEELGMTNTCYENSTGLDASNHYSTAKDTVLLLSELAKYDIVQKYSSIWMDELKHSKGRITELVNTNRLIKSNPDCYIAKTGHTDLAGYCICVYGKRNGTDLVACVMGETDSKKRFEDATTLLNYGFSNFDSVKVLDAETPIATIEISNAKQQTIDLYPSETKFILQNKGNKQEYTTNYSCIEKISAPIEIGQKLGEVWVTDSNQITLLEADLIAKERVQKKTYKEIIKSIIS